MYAGFLIVSRRFQSEAWPSSDQRCGIMPRVPRLDLAGVPQHVVQRGNDRQPCFFRDVDYLRYLQDLHEAALKFECRVHACVLMTHHVHSGLGVPGRPLKTKQVRT